MSKILEKSSHRARMEDGAIIPPAIRLPDCVKSDFVRWRRENYNGM